MCDWMNDPAFMAYAFECEQREKEAELQRRKDLMNRANDEEDNDE